MSRLREKMNVINLNDRRLLALGFLIALSIFSVYDYIGELAFGVITQSRAKMQKVDLRYYSPCK